MCRCDSQRPEFSSLDIGCSGCQVVEIEVDLTGQQGQLRRVAAVVRNMHGENLGLGFEHLARQMPAAAVATRSVVELPRVAARMFDQVGQGVDTEPVRGVGVDHQHVGHTNHLGDGDKIGARVKGHLVVQPGVDGMGCQGRDADREAVGSSFGDHVGSDIATTPRSVFDDHRPQAVAHAFGEYPGCDINRATSGIRNNDAYRLHWRLRQNRRC